MCVGLDFLLRCTSEKERMKDKSHTSHYYRYTSRRVLMSDTSNHAEGFISPQSRRQSDEH